MNDPTLICDKCGTENPAGRAYCLTCGAILVPDRPSPMWVRIVIATVLILLFAPIGLCGAAVTFGAVTEAIDGRTDSLVTGFLPIAIVSLAIGIGGLYLAYHTLWPK